MKGIKETKKEILHKKYEEIKASLEYFNELLRENGISTENFLSNEIFIPNLAYQ